MQRAELGEPGAPVCKQATRSPGMASGSEPVKEHSQDKGLEDSLPAPLPLGCHQFWGILLSWQVGGGSPPHPGVPCTAPALLGQGFACLILLYQSPGQWGADLLG